MVHEVSEHIRFVGWDECLFWNNLDVEGMVILNWLDIALKWEWLLISKRL